MRDDTEKMNEVTYRNPSQSCNETQPIWLYSLSPTMQTAGLAMIVWEGAPAYRRLLADADRPAATPEGLLLGTAAVVLIQISYWLRVSLIPTLALPRNVFLSHITLFFGRLRFILGAALFTVMYYRFPELEKSIPRLLVLIGVLFSMFCYSLELEWLPLQLNGRPRD
jgi:hypothetical protein